MSNYKLPRLNQYFDKYLRPRWLHELKKTKNQFRTIPLIFGLFERAWTLRGFENFLMDLATEEKFAEKLLDHITKWFLHVIDLLAGAPVDAIIFTDDHADQRSIIMGEDRWRRLFKPRWKQIYDRVHHYGLYTIMHMCGNTASVVPDLIEVGLDCMESCQPECMDVYELKKNYGKDIRFWGGLGAQSTLPFGNPQEVRREIQRLKQQMGSGGGYIFASAKGPDENVPVDNIAAYLEEANLP